MSYKVTPQVGMHGAYITTGSPAMGESPPYDEKSKWCAAIIACVYGTEELGYHVNISFLSKTGLQNAACNVPVWWPGEPILQRDYFTFHPYVERIAEPAAIESDGKGQGGPADPGNLLQEGGGGSDENYSKTNEVKSEPGPDDETVSGGATNLVDGQHPPGGPSQSGPPVEGLSEPSKPEPATGPEPKPQSTAS